ncbi:Tat pathway signal sequence domain protein [Streptomyces sp. bgisy159]|uniref:Tat pathway signal sequence domain protein n=1 Tax=Streptomyces sp. bgisy159 TaxID=3413795 RepID=UPI003F4A8103
MRTTVRRHLGKVVAGTAIAVAGTALMAAITLPDKAGADGDRPGGRSTTRQQGGQQGTAVPPGVVAPAPRQGTGGTGTDPLTADETRKAERIALDRQLRADGEDVGGERGPQPLGVDLAAPPSGDGDAPGAARRATVTFYDYGSDTLITRTVDIATGRVESTTRRKGIQPPLSPEEQTEAARLLIADPLGAGLRADYRDATGRELTGPDQLLSAAMVYRSVPGAQPAALDRCGEHRCARLLPKVRNGPWIDARSLVVDLSARTVVRLAH